MRLHLTFLADEPLPAGGRLRVEIRDTSLADAPAVLVKRIDTKVPAAAAGKDMTLTVELDAVPDGSTIWTHVDTDGNGRVSKGDFVTVESYPVGAAAAQQTTIRLRKVT